MNNEDPDFNLLNLKSNVTFAAMCRDDETRLARDQTPLVDLREIPRDRWPDFFHREVTVPPDVAAYLAAREPGRLTEEETQNMELAVERYHGITEPFIIIAGPVLQATGKAWRYVPEAAPFSSGFEFDSLKNDL